MKEVIQIRSEDLNDACRTLLVREWWYTYELLLREGSKWQKKLNQLTAEGEKRGIIRPGVPMPRDCAEDLAAKCDELLKSRKK